jgi:hypothetical protein
MLTPTFGFKDLDSFKGDLLGINEQQTCEGHVHMVSSMIVLGNQHPYYANAKHEKESR